MTPATHRIIVSAHRELREFVRELAHPDVVTATELEEMVSALEDIAAELEGVIEDIKADEDKAAAE